MKGNENILEVKDLRIKFFHQQGTVNAVNGVNLKIKSNKSIGLVGESGCGKSVTAYSLLKIIPTGGKITSGSIKFKKKDNSVIDIVKLDPECEEMRSMRGSEISMIFQEPMTAFSPVHTIGNQITESIILHQRLNKEEANNRAIELLDLVGISNPAQRIDEYPFQLSGGMRQRAMIAMALACNPRLLIADEPTTALDVTIQAQVLKLIKQMQQDFDLSLLLITHDLGVIAHMVEQVYVMYLGKDVEDGPVFEIFDNPVHPYTKDLLKSIPKVTGVKGKLASIKGSVPDAYFLPDGCTFHPRCRYRVGEVCQLKSPETVQIDENHRVSCFRCLEEEVDVGGKDGR